MYANHQSFRVLKEIGVEEHDGDVRFYIGSGNTTVSRMRNASGHGNSSFIMDVTMGQIPRSTEVTERISSSVKSLTPPIGFGDAYGMDIFATGGYLQYDLNL